MMATDNTTPGQVDGYRVPTDEERRAVPPRAFECVECGTDIAEHDERGAVGCVFEASVYYPFDEPE